MFLFFFFFFNDPAPTEISTLSLHDALPISRDGRRRLARRRPRAPAAHLRARRSGDGPRAAGAGHRSEEHTSELQSLTNLVCRLLLEKKKKNKNKPHTKPYKQ